MFHFLAPWHPGGAKWAHYHVLLTAALIVALVGSFTAGFGLGYRSGAEHNAQYFRTHFAAPLPVPTVKQAIGGPQATNLPASAGIHFNYFYVRLDDQGQLGSCVGWTMAKVLGYAVNWNVQPNGGHFHRFYSPRFGYDSVARGVDSGSYLSQYVPVAQEQGIPLWNAMPYGATASTVGLPAYALEWPVPSQFIAQASTHRIQVSQQSLWGFTNGAGAGGLALIKQALASHHAVAIAFPVYHEYDQANADGSTVLPPQPGEQERGGHENALVSYDDQHANGDGSFGAALASNQWGWNSGTGSDGIRHTDGTHNSFVWLSYQFIEQYVFDVNVWHVPNGQG